MKVAELKGKCTSQFVKAKKMHTRSTSMTRHFRKCQFIADIWRDYKSKWTCEAYMRQNKPINYTKRERVCYKSWRNTCIFRYQLYHVDFRAAKREVLLECYLKRNDKKLFYEHSSKFTFYWYPNNWYIWQSLWDAYCHKSSK